MFQPDIILSGLIVIALLAAGEVLAAKIKSFLPSILISALLYLILFWTGVLPADLMERSGFTSLVTVAISLIIISMGSSTDFENLRENAKTVGLAASIFVIHVSSVLAVMWLIYDKNTALGCLPGGSNVSLIIQGRARELGYQNIVVLSALLFSFKALVSCPLVALLIRREVKALLRDGTVEEAPQVPKPSSSAPATGSKNSFLSRVFYKGPCREDESFIITLLRLYAVAFVAGLLEKLTGLSRYVFCLILGILLGEAGFLHKDDLQRTGVSNFLMVMLMATVMSGFSMSSPAMLAELAVPLVIVLATEALSIFLASLVLRKLFGFSKPMAAAIGYQGMMGFPTNMIISRDVINALTDDEALREKLDESISTKLVLAGFTNTTILSVLVAGILINFMT